MGSLGPGALVGSFLPTRPLWASPLTPHSHQSWSKGGRGREGKLHLAGTDVTSGPSWGGGAPVWILSLVELLKDTAARASAQVVTIPPSCLGICLTLHLLYGVTKINTEVALVP